MKQSPLPSFAAYVRDGHLARAEEYVRSWKRRYVKMAKAIEPDRTRWQDVWDRVAWAILTANATYDSTRAAFALARADREDVAGVRWNGISGMTPAKVDYLAALHVHDGTFWYLRNHGVLVVGGGGESWDAYRLRLARSVRGLSLTKASYAACMLYPLEADVACLDTWVQKIFTWTSGFKSLSLAEYRAVEDQVRVIARRHGVSTALCQWMLWDCVRGTVTDQWVFE